MRHRFFLSLILKPDESLEVHKLFLDNPKNPYYSNPRNYRNRYYPNMSDQQLPNGSLFGTSAINDIGGLFIYDHENPTDPPADPPADADPSTPMGKLQAARKAIDATWEELEENIGAFQGILAETVQSLPDGDEQAARSLHQEVRRVHNTCKANVDGVNSFLKTINDEPEGEEPDLRFAIGVRVVCKVGDRDEDWLVGTIIGLWYTDKESGDCVPYLIELDNGRVIFAPEDSDDCIRKQLRFKVGTKVECLVESGWQPGTITGIWYSGDKHLQEGQVVPYLVHLDQENAEIFAPEDSGDFIRLPRD